VLIAKWDIVEHTNHFWLSTLTLISAFFLLEHPLHFPNLSEPLRWSFPAYPLFSHSRSWIHSLISLWVVGIGRSRSYPRSAKTGV
jgi:hypothetical protein